MRKSITVKNLLSLNRTTTYILVVCFFILTISSLLLYLETAYAEKVFPGVWIGTVRVSGFTKNEVTTTLERITHDVREKGIPVQYKNKKATIYPQVLALDPDIPVQHENIVNFNEDTATENAFSLGRSDTLWKNYLLRLSLILSPVHLPSSYQINDLALGDALKKEFSDLEKEPDNAHLSYDTVSKSLTVSTEQNGQQINIPAAHAQIEYALERGEHPRILLSIEEKKSTIHRDTLEVFLEPARKLLEKTPVTLTVGSERFTLDTSTIARAITVENNTLQLDTTTLKTYLEKTVSPHLYKEARDPRFSISQGVLTPLEDGKDGSEVDIEKSISAIQSGVLEGSQSIEIAIKAKSSPLIEIGSLPHLKLLAAGTTNFKGSPQNRKKNIALGMSRMNGVLLHPGDEFSLIHLLGKIDEKSGFLPELVIKGNVTKPEFGGGLCQVSTTLFRAVAQAGLPVLERQNHSYRVSYYEPPVGFDATIYYPKPDFRFKNDTASYIFIHAWTEGLSAHVQLWGLKDGRTVEIDTPTVYNIRKPESVKMVETDTLPPGQKKCTEHAHNGADAYFERRVTYADGAHKKDVFKSHYVVWPAVCLIGKATEPVVDELIGPVDSTELPEQSIQTGEPTPTENAISIP